MALPIWEAGLNLLAAAGLGAAIGFERQWRQRLAGLRTNTLVALGAATFILFGRLAGDTDSAARVGAQVVSGIGFLGAGVIFKEGLNVRGLNTAATLWCSAAVGLLAGIGFIGYAALCAALVVGSNVLLRPLVRAINRQPMDDTEVDRTYVAYVVCDLSAEPRARAILMEGLTAAEHIEVSELEIENIENTDRVELTATITSHRRRELALENHRPAHQGERGVARRLEGARATGLRAMPEPRECSRSPAHQASPVEKSQFSRCPQRADIRRRGRERVKSTAAFDRSLKAGSVATNGRAALKRGGSGRFPYYSDACLRPTMAGTRKLRRSWSRTSSAAASAGCSRFARRNFAWDLRQPCQTERWRPP
jgi:putative Mg2+ transporter-C (MgtC) family protein